MGSKKYKKQMKREKPVKRLTVLLLLGEVIIQLLAILVEGFLTPSLVLWISLACNGVILIAWLVLKLTAYSLHVKVEVEKDY